MPPDLAPMLVAIVLIVTVAFVSIVRPIAKPLVRLLEAMIREREQLPGQELGAIHRTLEGIDQRLHLIEERQSFYEALSGGKELPELTPPATSEEPPVSDPTANG